MDIAGADEPKKYLNIFFARAKNTALIGRESLAMRPKSHQFWRFMGHIVPFCLKTMPNYDNRRRMRWFFRLSESGNLGKIRTHEQPIIAPQRRSNNSCSKRKQSNEDDRRSSRKIH